MPQRLVCIRPKHTRTHAHRETKEYKDTHSHSYAYAVPHTHAHTRSHTRIFFVRPICDESVGILMRLWTHINALDNGQHTHTHAYTHTAGERA